MSYSEKLNTLVKDTIEYYSTLEEVTQYSKYYINLEYYNKLYKNKVDLFFTENNIEQSKFFYGLNKFNIIPMLKKLEGNTSNILYNFAKYFITEQAIDQRFSYNSNRPILDDNMINDIRYWLFNNSYNSDMLSLEEQNIKMTNYVHFNAGMKKIKTVN